LVKTNSNTNIAYNPKPLFFVCQGGIIEKRKKPVRVELCQAQDKTMLLPSSAQAQLSLTGG
jgi:hypothetical protein